jgi:ribosome-binding factor A
MASIVRAQRIADRIKEELSTMLIHELSDPRLTGASITDVKVDREIAYANIYVSAIEGEQRSKDILEGFQRAAGFIRRYLSHEIELRTFPQLRFHWDPTPENAERIENLLNDLKRQGQASGDITTPGLHENDK